METAEVLDRSIEYLRSHVPEDYPKDTLSYSNLKEFATCTQRWKYRYIDGIKSPKTSSMRIGGAIHFGIEAYYLGHDPLLAAQGHLAERWQDDSRQDYQGAYVAVARVIDAYVKAYPNNRCEGVELKTSVDLGSGVMLVAVTDLLQQPTVIDHKTGKRREFTPDPLQLAVNALCLHANGYTVTHGEIRRLRRDIKGTTKRSPIVTSYPYVIDADFMREHVKEIVKRMEGIAMRTRLDVWSGPPPEINEGHRFCEFACMMRPCDIYDRPPAQSV